MKTKYSVYQNDFSSWSDVVGEFTGNTYDTEAKKKALKEHPEPSEVLYANYDLGGYEGYAIVIWRDGRKYYWLEGSHCSCYGLEEAGFDPEEYKSKAFFIECLKRMNRGYSSVFNEEEKTELIKKLEKR